MANEPATPDDVLRALANIHRLRILHALSEGALWVSDLQARLLSQHLARLRDAEALTLVEGLLRLVDRREDQQP
ncbi:hypothetical protein [Caulobacter sp.]|uniref:hypothetical protein n=1 Tax=Caulobacter sp. TaxID=78 RepID=UPI003BB03109